MVRAVLKFTHVPKNKYKLINSIICVGMFLCTLYAHICAYARLINEARLLDPIGACWSLGRQGLCRRTAPQVLEGRGFIGATRRKPCCLKEDTRRSQAVAQHHDIKMA